MEESGNITTMTFDHGSKSNTNLSSQGASPAPAGTG